MGCGNGIIMGCGNGIIIILHLYIHKSLLYLYKFIIPGVMQEFSLLCVLLASMGN
jgi:hypothetical protein